MFNSKQPFLPESDFHVDPNMCFSKILIAYLSQNCITGKITRLDSINHLLVISLGNSFTGIMPYSDATIYPIYMDNGELSPNIYTLVGKTIRAKISNIVDDIIYLSRKDNMLNAIKYFKGQKEVLDAKISGFSKKSVFVDMGAGITGICYASDFSKTVYRNVLDIGLKKYDKIPVHITEFNEDINKFKLSRVEALPLFQDNYSVGDIITCKVFEPIGDGIGYFVCIDSKFSGIVDCPQNLKLQYGDWISAYISKITEKGARLNLMQQL